MTTTVHLEAGETLHRLATLADAIKADRTLYDACFAVAKAACIDEANDDRVANIAFHLQQALTALDA